VNLIVDTSVWSYFLRRENNKQDNPYTQILIEILESRENVHLPGVVLMELLDGLAAPKKFKLLETYLKPFPLIELNRKDFIEAARLKTKCRSKGIQAGIIDFLIASICVNRTYPLLTADKDFKHIARHCGLKLWPVPGF